MTVLSLHRLKNLALKGDINSQTHPLSKINAHGWLGKKGWGVDSDNYLKVQYNLLSYEELESLEFPKQLWASSGDFNFSASLM